MYILPSKSAVLESSSILRMLHQYPGANHDTAGLVFTLIGVISFMLVMPSSALADRFGRKWAIVPAGYLECIGLALIAAIGTPLGPAIAFRPSPPSIEHGLSRSWRK